MADIEWVRPSEFSAALAAVLRAARRDAGMTLRAVRKASEGYFRPSAINGYERSQRQISVDRLCHLAIVYGTTGDELLRRTLASLGQLPPPAPPETRSRADTLKLFYRRVIAEGDVSLIDELCTPGFVDHEMPSKARLPRNAEGFRTWMERFHHIFPSVDLDVEDMLFVGDQAVVRVNLNLGYPIGEKESGTTMRKLSLGASEWIRFEGAKLAERWGFDAGWLLEQVRMNSGMTRAGAD